MPFSAEARIVCRLRGTTADLEIGAAAKKKESHPVFHGNPILERLLRVPAMKVGTMPDNCPVQCRAQAVGLIAYELPAAYEVDPDDTKRVALQGHAWREGGWVPTSQAFYGHAFPLLRNGSPVTMTCAFEKINNNQPQALELSFWVVVQPS